MPKKKAFKKQKKVILDFNLLPDKPILADKKEDDRFGYQEIAKTIFRLIKRSKSSFALGLYGKWGVGKTTIAGFVEELAKKGRYATFYFDVWKYEKDSLRRQFLIRLDEELELGLKFKETLNQSLTRPTHLNLKESIRMIFKNLLFRIIGIITLILILAWIISFFIKIPDLLFDYRQLISALASLGILSSFISFILSSFKILHGSIQEYRTDSAEGFEDKFNEALTEIEEKRLLIIVDNIDRLEHRKAVDALSDIKTFLIKERDISEKTIIFLIPCDNEALIDHLNSVYGDAFNADEFLRKFFNLTFKIPKFIDLELDNYIKELLLQTGILEFKGNRDLESVIIYAFRDNPREIKQFINSLIGSFLLAKKRELDVVINNVPFLAKLTVIRQKFPQIYRILEERTLRALLNFNDSELKDILRRELKSLFIAEGKNLSLQDIEVKIDYEIARFEAFHDPTIGIIAENIDLFFALHQSKEEKKIPEWGSYVLAAEEKRIEDVKSIFDDIKARGLCQQLDDLLGDRIKKQKKGAQLVNLISSSIKVFYKADKSMPRSFDEMARYFPDSTILFKNLDDFGPRIIFGFIYPNTTPSSRGNFVNSFVGLLRMGKDDNTSALPENYALEFLNIIAEKKHYFVKHREIIKKGIEDHFYTEQFLAIFVDSDLKQEFITGKAKEKFINSININDYVDDEEETKKQLRKTLEYWSNLILSKDEIAISIKKYKSLIEGTSADDWRRTILIDYLIKFINKHKNLMKEKAKDIKEEIGLLSGEILRVYDQLIEEDKIRAIYIIDFLISLEENSQATALKEKIREFIKTSSEHTIGEIPQKMLNRWVRFYPEAILEKAKSYPSWFIERRLFFHLSKDQNNEIVNDLIDHNNILKIELLDKINYQVSSGTIEKLIKQIKNREELITKEELEILKKIGIKKHIDYRDELFEYLITTANKGRSEKIMIRKIVKNYKNLFTQDQQKKIMPRVYKKSKRKIKK